MLSHRFEIQDIVAQDSFGVIYHALDAETGNPVAVRRFFPYGADGGGLFDEERTEYAAVVARLAGLHHPGLRAVLTGGCDPVDGMPFVATEWIEGESLADMLQRGFFTPVGAIGVLDRALEISEALSEVLGAGAVWVETAPSLIIVDGGESRRGLTFSMAPMKWIGNEASQRSLLPLAELAENLLGWSGRRVPAQAGQGLGAWVKWLRANANDLTLRQMRESLAGLGCVAAPAAAPRGAPSSEPPVDVEPPLQGAELPLPAMSSPQPVRVRKSSTKEPLVLIAALAVLVVSAGWWVSQHPVAHAPRRVVAAKPATPPTNGLLARAAASPAPAASVPDRPLPDGVFRSGETQRIMEEAGREVTVEGVLKYLRVSDSGKTLYLEFMETTPKEEVRGCFATKKVTEDMSEQSLTPLIGKRIRISGVVRTMHHFSVKWPEVVLKDRNAIQEVK